MSRRVLKLVVAYDGTGYVGWQRQAAGVSVQGLLEDAFLPLNGGRAVQVAGSGRTDAGVHAWGQVASCEIDSPLDGATILRALNARLPGDVRVRDVTDAPAGFHARYWCTSKSYVYRVLNGALADPHVRAFAWNVRPPLDADAMRSALLEVVGTHDFRAFQSTGTRVSSTVRTLTAASMRVREWQGLFPIGEAEPRRPAIGDGAGERLLEFAFTGDGFLRHMVRALVGTIVEVGLGRRDRHSVTRALVSGERSAAGPNAPPHGLMLMRVEHRTKALEPREP